MKKMMMIVSAILVAAISQAVSVGWTAKDLGDYVGATGYLIKADDFATAKDLLAAGNSNLTDDEGKSYAWGNPATVLDAGTVGNAATASGVTVDYPGSEVKYGAYMAVVTAADKDGNYKYFISDKAEITVKSANGAKMFAFGSQANATWETYTASGSGGGDDPIIPDVPEPTSMALLALGAAAFGLRRKFSK